MKTLQIGFMIPAHYPAGTSPWDVYQDFLKNPLAETWGVTLLTPDAVFESVIAKARDAALEEAAMVADEFFADTEAEEVELIASNSIGFAIRALKDTPAEEDKA